MSDHALTLISTWAEVAILLFMVWEAYGPRMGASVMSTLHLRSPPSTGILGRIWDNRTLIVAVPGLAFVGWLYLGRGPAVEESQKSTLMEWVERAQHELAEAKRSATADEAQKATLNEWLQQANRERDNARQEVAAAEAQKATLIDWLQTAHHERDDARQERDQIQKNLQSQRLGASSEIYITPPLPTAAEECVTLAQRLARLDPVMGKVETEHIRSTMTALGCGCDASKK
jgi:hypothetical protein